MNTISYLFVTIVVVMIMSFGAGLIIGGPDKGKQIISWEFKQLMRLGRWILKQLLHLIAEMCQWAHSKL